LGCSVVICVVCVLSRYKCVLPLGDNPIAVNKYIILLLLYCIPYQLTRSRGAECF
jgi:hypothetical protein